MADTNQIRFAPLLWPTAPHPAIQSNDNKGNNKPKDRAYRHSHHEQQDQPIPDSNNHLDEYA